MKVDILNGIFTDTNGDFRISYPKNYVPIVLNNNINNGYLRPAPGIVKFGDGPGVDRGAINWNNECYRVMGTKLVKIDEVGNSTTIGDVGGSGYVTMVSGKANGIEYIAIASNGNLFLYDGTTLTQNTDPDIGTVIDVTWIDGYFFVTNGSQLKVTELNNPFAVRSLFFTTSEADPDPVTGVENIRNEVYAANRYTIEIFDNIGGDGFPFQRIEGAQIEKGVIGTHASTVFMQNLAFVGSGREEAPSVYMASNGQAISISTIEIDRILEKYTETQLLSIKCEARRYHNREYFYIHLPDKTLAYDGTGSRLLGQPIWFILHSGLENDDQYRAQNIVWCYNKWLVGDPKSSSHGYLVDNIGSHYGNRVGWEFATSILYNEGMGAIINEIELVCLTGNVALGDDPTVYTDYSTDGLTFSNPKPKKTGKQGKRSKRIVWLKQGAMEDRRIQRFTGNSDSHLTVTKLDMKVEPLNV